jgi:hypothetical protein
LQDGYSGGREETFTAYKLYAIDKLRACCWDSFGDTSDSSEDILLSPEEVKLLAAMNMHGTR